MRTLRICILETSEDLQTNAACVMPSRLLPKSACEALNQVHPDVCKRYFGCGLVVPEKLEGCKRDCVSKLMGESGHDIGLDTTDEMALHHSSNILTKLNREFWIFKNKHCVCERIHGAAQ
ncbi:arsenite methyltransferase-like [Myxocyprinus asiaticus]|uniref:arsenite methyltransferase-like n=1 Tax=Myxocyprinus asiaticus TaxID=70543 RepID=UPI002221B2B7|nr:arsenite methyltransferase-like [Myxocyprinus asiaticus]